MAKRTWNYDISTGTWSRGPFTISRVAATGMFRVWRAERIVAVRPTLQGARRAGTVLFNGGRVAFLTLL
jgi:hypothetical protein